MEMAASILAYVFTWVILSSLLLILLVEISDRLNLDSDGWVLIMVIVWLYLSFYSLFKFLNPVVNWLVGV